MTPQNEITLVIGQVDDAKKAKELVSGTMDANYVSPAFGHLEVPEPKKKKRSEKVHSADT